MLFSVTDSIRRALAQSAPPHDARVLLLKSTKESQSDLALSKNSQVMSDLEAPNQHDGRDSPLAQARETGCAELRQDNTSIQAKDSADYTTSNPSRSSNARSRHDSARSGSVPTQIVGFPGEALERFWPSVNTRDLDTTGFDAEPHDDQGWVRDILMHIGTLFDADAADWLLDEDQNMNDEIDAVLRCEEEEIGYKLNSSLRLWLSVPTLYEELLDSIVEDSIIDNIKAIQVNVWLIVLLVSDRVRNLVFGTRLYVWLVRQQVEADTLTQLDLSAEAQKYWYHDISGGTEEESFRIPPQDRKSIREISSEQLPLNDSITKAISRRVSVRNFDHDQELEVITKARAKQRRDSSATLVDSRGSSKQPQRHLGQNHSPARGREYLSAEDAQELETLQSELGRIKLGIDELKDKETKVVVKLTKLERGSFLSPNSLLSPSNSLTRLSADAIEEAPRFRSYESVRKVPIAKRRMASGPLRCKNLGCERTFANHAELGNHMAAGMHRFVCPQPGCRGKSFHNQAEFSNHYEVLHEAHEEDMPMTLSQDDLESWTRKVTIWLARHQDWKDEPVRPRAKSISSIVPSVPWT